MNLAAIRADLATVLKTAGLNAWDYQPDDPQDLPAGVVGGVRSMVRLNRAVTEVELVVTLYASLADPLDATRVLDQALSYGDPAGFLEALDAVRQQADSPAWSSVRFVSAGPYTRYGMPGGLAALGVEIVLALTG